MPQTSGKIAAFFKTIIDELFYPNSFESTGDMVLNLATIFSSITTSENMMI